VVYLKYGISTGFAENTCDLLSQTAQHWASPQVRQRTDNPTGGL
jgi:CO/xanthine dehydrogenase FAD-binding subunit